MLRGLLLLPPNFLPRFLLENSLRAEREGVNSQFQTRNICSLAFQINYALAMMLRHSSNAGASIGHLFSFASTLRAALRPVASEAFRHYILAVIYKGL